jgi:hypothetical protein
MFTKARMRMDEPRAPSTLEIRKKSRDTTRNRV